MSVQVPSRRAQPASIPSDTASRGFSGTTPCASSSRAQPGNSGAPTSLLAVAGGGHRGRDVGHDGPAEPGPRALRAALMTMSAVA
jgi:hypothetical protein